MTLSELVFTIRGRENVEDADAALLEDAEQAVPAVLAGGVMMDTVANDHIDDAIHHLAAKHWAWISDLPSLNTRMLHAGRPVATGFLIADHPAPCIPEP